MITWYTSQDKVGGNVAFAQMEKSWFDPHVAVSDEEIQTSLQIPHNGRSRKD